MQAGWCAVCGADVHEEFGWKRGNPEFLRLARRPDAMVRVVVCSECGHGYQDPILDGDELSRLYDHPGGAMWDESKPDPRAVDAWTEWILHAACPGRRPGAAVDLSLVGDGHRKALRAAGWEVEAAAPWPLGRLSTRTGVSLALLPYTLERLPDPVPLLKVIRRSLLPDGRLSVLCEDLLNPLRGSRTGVDRITDAQARLYSLNTVQAVLVRAGFETEKMCRFDRWGSVGVIAAPCERPPMAPADDAHAVQQLYDALRRPGSADPLGHNLAALAETQPAVLPVLCQKMPSAPYRVRRSGHCLVAVTAKHHPGGGEPVHDLPIVQWGGLDGLMSLPDEMPTASSLIQLGLGTGELAAALAERLRPEQHLFIWEADPQLAKVVLEVVDLSPIWLSTQVTLLLGMQPYRSPEQRRCLAESTFVFSTRSARQWNTWMYRDIISGLSSGADYDTADAGSSSDITQVVSG